MQQWIHEIISYAKAERLRFLNLGQCGLESFPEEILDLTELEVLNLGTHYYEPEAGKVVESGNHGLQNSIRSLPRALSRLRRLRSISFRGNPVEDAHVLAELPHLRHVDLSGTCIKDTTPLARITGLTHLWLGSPLAQMGVMLKAIRALRNTYNFEFPESVRGLFRSPTIADFTPLASLTELCTLDLSLTEICDIAQIAGLRNLRELNLAGTPVQDLGPLRSLVALEQLHIDNSSVCDLSDLASLHRLSHLSLDGNAITSVEALTRLTGLEDLSISGCQLDSIAPISALINLSRLTLLGFVGDLRPLAGLQRLSSLSLGNNHEFPTPKQADTEDSPLSPVDLDTSHIAALASLKELDLFHIRDVDLAGIGRLPDLRRFSSRQCPLGDLGPLRKAECLVQLSVIGAAVEAIDAITNLHKLEELDLSQNPIVQLPSLTALSALKTLDLHDTRICDLAPIAALTGLTKLNVASTLVETLSPLHGLRNLTSLVLSQTKVVDVSPVSAFSRLVHLDIAETQSANLAPLAVLAALNRVILRKCPVSDLRPLLELPMLQAVVADHCAISAYPQYLLQHPRLHTLSLAGNPITDCPAELLGGDRRGSDLRAVRAHFADLEHGGMDDRELKLIVVGNGRVGKTSVIQRLVGGAFDPAEESTHGIRMECWSPSLAGGPVRLNIWDFGGQDIYFGTHELFLRSRAIFLVVWDKETERSRYQEFASWRFENRPLSFWLDYIAAASPGAKVVIVENKCDDGRAHPIPADQGGRPSIAVSAATGYGMVETLAAMVRETCQLELSIPRSLGAGRHAVKRAIRALQDADEGRPRQERKHRTLSYEAFTAMCAEEGARVSSPEALLAFLHHTGVIFYQPDIFGGRLILDQRWALDAIYTIFDRKDSYRQLVHRKGLFRPTDLDDLAWRGSLSQAEQSLILGLMRSCSICFQVGDFLDEDPEHIAPEFLPERGAVTHDIEIRHLSADTAAELWYRYEHRFLHQGIMRRFMNRVGQSCGGHAVYWRGGVIFSTKRSRTIAEVTCQRHSDADLVRGEIRILVRGGQRHRLLTTLLRTFKELQSTQVQARECVSLDGKEWIDVAKLPDAAISGRVVSDSHNVHSFEPFRFLLHSPDEGEQLEDTLLASKARGTAPTRASNVGTEVQDSSPGVPPVPHVDAGPVTRPRILIEELTALFCRLYDEPGLRRLVHSVAGPRLGDRLPTAPSSMEDMAFQSARVLDQDNYVDSALFARMREDRPRRQAEIDQVALLIPGK